MYAQDIRTYGICNSQPLALLVVMPMPAQQGIRKQGAITPVLKNS
jgi:hypothetical protein